MSSVKRFYLRKKSFSVAASISQGNFRGNRPCGLTRLINSGITFSTQNISIQPNPDRETEHHLLHPGSAQTGRSIPDRLGKNPLRGYDPGNPPAGEKGYHRRLYGNPDRRYPGYTGRGPECPGFAKTRRKVHLNSVDFFHGSARRTFLQISNSEHPYGGISLPPE